MKRILAALLLAGSSLLLHSAPILADLTAIKPGPITVTATDQAITVRWSDAAHQNWQAVFSLDSSKPLVSSIAVDGHEIVSRARP